MDYHFQHGVACTAGFIFKDIHLVDNISHTETSNILLKDGIKWRNSKTILGTSLDPEYNLKKRESKK